MPRLYQNQQLENARNRIRDLPERPPKPKAIPLSQLVKELRDEIDAAVKRNNDLTHIVEVLREVDVEITETTLRSYLRMPRKPATGTPRAKPRKAVVAPPPAKARKIAVAPTPAKTGTKAVPMPSAEDL